MEGQAVLLRDGSAAFPAIIACMRAARRSIEINMFLWRDDDIGRTLATEVLAAADRGVRVSIVKDHYGIGLEYCEECQRPLFHGPATRYERASIRVLEWLYNRDLLAKERYDRSAPLLERLSAHPNITLHIDERRYDHSKFYIFDDEVLMLGGINVENKENGSDRAGRRYRDYMVQLTDTDAVNALRARLAGLVTSENECFAVNVKQPTRFFEMEERYLRLIDESERELTILMAYFAPVPGVMRAIQNAALRGVRIRIMIPARANFMDDLNRLTMARLFRFARKSGTDLTIYLSPCMAHTKLLMSERRVSVGSCNITRNAFHTLNELNYEAENDGSPFAQSVRESVRALLDESAEVRSLSQLRYRPHMTLLERLVM